MEGHACGRKEPDKERKVEAGVLILIEHLFCPSLFPSGISHKDFDMVHYSIMPMRKQKMRKVTPELTHDLRPSVSNAKAPGQFTIGHSF